MKLKIQAHCSSPSLMKITRKWQFSMQCQNGDSIHLLTTDLISLLWIPGAASSRVCFKRVPVASSKLKDPRSRYLFFTTEETARSRGCTRVIPFWTLHLSNSYLRKWITRLRKLDWAHQATSKCSLSSRSAENRKHWILFSRTGAIISDRKFLCNSQ